MSAVEGRAGRILPERLPLPLVEIAAHPLEWRAVALYVVVVADEAVVPRHEHDVAVDVLDDAALSLRHHDGVALHEQVAELVLAVRAVGVAVRVLPDDAVERVDDGVLEDVDIRGVRHLDAAVAQPAAAVIAA